MNASTESYLSRLNVEIKNKNRVSETWYFRAFIYLQILLSILVPCLAVLALFPDGSDIFLQLVVLIIGLPIAGVYYTGVVALERQWKYGKIEELTSALKYLDSKYSLKNDLLSEISVAHKMGSQMSQMQKLMKSIIMVFRAS